MEAVENKGTAMPESIQEKGVFQKWQHSKCAAAMASVLGTSTDRVMFRGHSLEV